MTELDTDQKGLIIRFESKADPDLRVAKAMAFLIGLAESQPQEPKAHE